MTNRVKTVAERNDILSLMEKLEQGILNINGVPSIDFDIDNYDEIPYIILVPEYDVKMENFFEDRKRILQEILKVCIDNGLTRTEDRLEDMGEHFYIVMRRK